MFYSIAATAAPDPGEFARNMLAADHACYTAAADRADFARLRAAIAAFPQGFRLYLMKQVGGTDMPVGYTGWYPVAEDVFDRLHDAPAMLTNRGQIMPSPEGDYLYLFNYSIVPALQKTPHSRTMLKELAQAVTNAAHKGLAAVTVSPDGVRVAERFGMSYRGNMTHQDVTEGVYAMRL